jgi:8-oxo-dGTP pyrophosphatase MutT (NUDIX family)
MLMSEKPVGFHKQFDVVGCVILCNDKFLLLHRHPHKPNGGLWGLPAGKAEPGENMAQALMREVREETGIDLVQSQLTQVGSYFVQHETSQFEWHVFSVQLKDFPQITISPSEHSEFRWVTLDEARTLPAIHDLDSTLDVFFS